MIQFDQEKLRTSLMQINTFLEEYTGKLDTVGSETAEKLKNTLTSLSEVVKRGQFEANELKEIITVTAKVSSLLTPQALKILQSKVKMHLLVAVSSCNAAAKMAEKQLQEIAVYEVKGQEENKEVSGTTHVTIPNEKEALQIAQQRIEQFIKHGILCGKDRFRLQKGSNTFSVTLSSDNFNVMNDQPVYVNLILSISGSNNCLANLLDALFGDVAKGPIDIVLEKQDEDNAWWFTTPRSEIIDLLMYRARYSAMMVMTVESIVEHGEMTGSAPNDLKSQVFSLQKISTNAFKAHEYAIQSSIKPGAVLYVLAPQPILYELKNLLPSNSSVVLIPVTDEVFIKRGKLPLSGVNQLQRAVSVDFKVPDYNKALREVLTQLVVEGKKTAVIHMTRLH